MRKTKVIIGTALLGIAGTAGSLAAPEVIVSTASGLPYSSYTLRGGTTVIDDQWTLTDSPDGEQKNVHPIVESPGDYWAPQTIVGTKFIKPPPRLATSPTPVDYLNHQKGLYTYQYSFTLQGAQQWNLYLNAFADDKAFVYIDKVDPLNLVFSTTPWSVVLKDVRYPINGLAYGENTGLDIGSNDPMFYTTLFNSPLLRAGDHTLIVAVENSGYNPPWWGQTGFDLKARFVPVPEPATCFAGFAALAMLGFFGWSNRKQT